MANRVGRPINPDLKDVRLTGVPSEVKVALDEVAQMFGKRYTEIAIGVLIEAMPRYKTMYASHFEKKAKAMRKAVKESHGTKDNQTDG